MPGRLRQSARQSETTAQDEGRYNIPGLEFSQPLTWKAGKALAVADLLLRLQKLATELRSLEQGQIQAKEFRQLAQDLAHTNLLGHKDKGVRAWTLCCIVDILNICAPDAPFHPAQLRDIFKVVNNLLQNLAEPANAYNSQHIYILNSLTDTKSIVLVTDQEKSEELITPLFRICFDIVSGATQNASGQELAKSVEFQLRSMLCTIIDEAALPHEVIDIILSQYLRVDPRIEQEAGVKAKKQDAKDKKQDTLHLKDYPPAYNMAKAICTTCTEKMTTYVSQYVGTILMDAANSLTEDAPSTKMIGRKASEVDDEDLESTHLSDLQKAHRLVRELWRACPDVLINVIPQIEVELFADSASLRQIATEALGDIIAGIGIAGIPPTKPLDPATYPLPSIDGPQPTFSSTNPLLLPASPKPFRNIHTAAYTAFLGRRVDKSASVRNAWTVAVGRILLTDAGGIGLSAEDRKILLSGYAGMLKDSDDKVRHTAIQQLRMFDYHSFVTVLTFDGGLSNSGTLLSHLADRLTDRKHNVREDAMSLLAQLWGTASKDIQESSEQVASVLGDIPSRICNAMYVNDLHIHLQIDRCFFESLLPLSYPPNKTTKAESQKRSKGGPQDLSNIDPDRIRAERILTLVRSLDTRAKQVFFGIQKRQVDMSRVMNVFLKACEDYNGGVVDDDSEEQKLKDQLTKYIQAIAKQFSDPGKATTDLWKFVKMHDRRNYQLIRFAVDPERDYRSMRNSIRELLKKLQGGPPSVQTIEETLLPLLYRSALIVYNRSHVPAIMEISRSDDAGLAETAHEVLKEISARNPEVLKTHVQSMCRELEQSAPSDSQAESSSAADTLKACAGFARKYPGEVPKDRKFLAAMTSYALHSNSARAAKHATTILLLVSDKKELHAEELMGKAVKNCSPESANYAGRLATISQICLLAPSAARSEEEVVLDIAIANCLQKNRSPDEEIDQNAWEADPSQEATAKQLSMRVMLNRCRSADDKTNVADFDLLANSVIKIFMALIENNGEITPTEDTPWVQRNRLRLTAAQYILKLCSHKPRAEELVAPPMFITMALIVINPPNAVRAGFIHQLQKYLGQGKLHARWYTIFFLAAFEPDEELKSKTAAWLKSRVAYHERQQKQLNKASSDRNSSRHNIMENVFARLLSLLAHHPDYPDSESAEFEDELLDFAKYIVFYLQCVANEDNISLIFHIAQRVKQTRDAIVGSEEFSERLYVLSDLAQAVIRNFADFMPGHAKGVNLLQTWPGKVALPTSQFAALPSSTVAQEIAAKNYLPEEVALNLEKLVRSTVRGGKSKDKQRTAANAEKKRKSGSVDLDDSDVEKKPKKAKKGSTLPIRRTPKATKRKNRDDEKDGDLSVEQPSRKSARASAIKSYAESSDDEDVNMSDAVESSPIKRTKKSGKPKTIDTDQQVTEAEAGTDDMEEVNHPSEEDITMEGQLDADKEVDDAEDITSEAIDAIESDMTDPDPDGDRIEPTTGLEIEHDDEEGGEAEKASTAEADGNENEEAEAEGTPSPQPKSTRLRASRSKAAAPTKTNGTTKSKPATKSTSKPKSQSKARPELESNPELNTDTKTSSPAQSTSTKKSTRNAAAIVAKLNATASTSAKKGNAKGASTKEAKKEKDSASADVSSPAAPATGTRRSARTARV